MPMVNTLGKNSRHALPRKDRSPLAALLPALAMLCFSFGIAPGAQAATFTVTKTADTNDGICDADCSLREAIRAANANAGADTITFNNLAGSPDLYTLTIPGSLEDAAATGDLDITDTVTIMGIGASETIIQAGTNNTNGIDKVFSVNQVTGNASATFNGVTVRFGSNTNVADLATFSHIGAGIDFFGASGTPTACGSEKLTITNSVITDNTVANAAGFGAGLSPDNANVEITNSTISNNKTTTGVGGGISHTGANCTLTITNSMVSGNMAQGGSQGGGIFIQQNRNGTATISGSTMSGNTAESHGGGILISSQGDAIQGALNTNISNSTISNNTSSGVNGGTARGGGIYITTNVLAGGGNTTLTNVTITGNHADTGPQQEGGGIFNNLGNMTMSLSRIVGNSATTGRGLFRATTAGTVTAENNWWGCDGFPGAAGIQRACFLRRGAERA